MLYVILVVLILGIVSLVLFAWSISYDVRRFQEFNLKRQDLAAERMEQILKQAVEATGIVANYQIGLDKKLDEVSNTVTEQNISVDSHLQKLQALVNSDVAAARRDELIRTKELKVAIERIVTLTSLARQQPDSMYITQLESATSRIEDLETILGVRTY